MHRVGRGHVHDVDLGISDERFVGGVLARDVKFGPETLCAFLRARAHCHDRAGVARSQLLSELVSDRACAHYAPPECAHRSETLQPKPAVLEEQPAGSVLFAPACY